MSIRMGVGFPLRFWRILGRIRESLLIVIGGVEYMLPNDEVCVLQQ
jgi:hypothetical protein